MKKETFLKIISCALFLVVLTINVKISLRDNVESDLILANIEALSRQESGNGVSCTNHYKEIESGGCRYHCCLGTDGYWHAIYTIGCEGR